MRRQRGIAPEAGSERLRLRGAIPGIRPRRKRIIDHLAPGHLNDLLASPRSNLPHRPGSRPPTRESTPPHGKLWPSGRSSPRS